ncbi:MAG: pyridoxal kinase PdxY [Treponema sp.]|jgi:pyridoxine kinase|nr:pyridoxal kinase PdxY [Treponema sp.]
MSILSIQSHVVYGHAGNSSAVFPLQRLGHAVWAINTVEFSNHTGYGSWTGQWLSPQLTRDLVRGLAERGVLGQTEAVLSGYMGDVETGSAVMDAVRRVKTANPTALYCCDPVMGDVGRGLYVKPGIPEIFKNEIVRRADIVTPNQFELEVLTGLDTSIPGNARRAVEELHAMGPKIALITSFTAQVKSEPRISMLASDGKEMFITTTPELPFPPGMAGSGDLTSALFLSRYLETHDIKRTLELTTGSIFAVMDATFKANSKELHIIAVQDELVAPSRSFEAVPFL